MSHVINWHSLNLLDRFYLSHPPFIEESRHVFRFLVRFVAIWFEPHEAGASEGRTAFSGAARRACAPLRWAERWRPWTFVEHRYQLRLANGRGADDQWRLRIERRIGLGKQRHFRPRLSPGVDQRSYYFGSISISAGHRAGSDERHARRLLDFAWRRRRLHGWRPWSKWKYRKRHGLVSLIPRPFQKLCKSGRKWLSRTGFLSRNKIKSELRRRNFDTPRVSAHDCLET